MGQQHGYNKAPTHHEEMRYTNKIQETEMVEMVVYLPQQTESIHCYTLQICLADAEKRGNPFLKVYFRLHEVKRKG